MSPARPHERGVGRSGAPGSGAAGPTAVVTGASSGIGLATVLRLARGGFRAVGTVRSAEKAEVVRRAAAAAGVTVETRMLDVTDAAGGAEVVSELRPYALVNNAGFGVSGAVEDVTDDEARAAFEAMVLAPVRLARLALPFMREAGGGRIVNVSSIFGRTTTPLAGWYQASKHALEAVTDALRVEVASSGVGVSLVEPGGFRTAIWDDFDRQVDRPGTRYAAAYRNWAAAKRATRPMLGDPDRVAATIEGAIRARRPGARYLVGYDARLVAALEPAVPTAVRDWIARRTLGL